MYVFVIRVAVHGFIGILLRVKEAVNLCIIKETNIAVADSLLVCNLKNIADRIP